MESQTYNLVIEKGANNEYTARLGGISATGTTKGIAAANLMQRINGLPNAEQAAAWTSGQATPERTKSAG